MVVHTDTAGTLPGRSTARAAGRDGATLPAWPVRTWRALIDRPAWLAGLTIVLMAIPAGGTPETTPGAHIAPADVSAALLMVLVTLRLIRPGGPRLPKPLVLLSAGVIIAGGVAAVHAADQTAAVLGWVRFTELFVLVPVAVALSLRSRADVLFLVVPLVGVAAVEGWIGYRQHLTGTGASFGQTAGRAIGTFGAYDIMGMATVVGCGVIVLIAVAFVARGALRWVAVGGAAALLAPLAYSYSRGVWIGTAVGVVVVILAAGWRRGVVVLAMTALIGALMIGSGALAANPMTARLDTIATSITKPDNSVNDRYGLWTAAGAMWRDHPVTGVGIKNFAQGRDRYAPVSVSATSDIADPAGGFRRVELLSPHNLYLLILSEQGLVGALAYGGALLAILVAGFRRVRRDSVAGSAAGPARGRATPDGTVQDSTTGDAAVSDRATPDGTVQDSTTRGGGSGRGRDPFVRLLGLLAAGTGAYLLVTSLYGDPGGSSALFNSVLLGVPIWWALGGGISPSPGLARARARLRRAWTGGRS